MNLQMKAPSPRSEWTQVPELRALVTHVASYPTRARLFLLALLASGVSLSAADARIPVTPEQFSGPLVFFATPANRVFEEPVPFGFVNNLTDSGWIWPRVNDNSGFFTVDFGKPAAIKKFRVYTTYNGGERAAVWNIAYSNDDSTYTTAIDWEYHPGSGLGVDDEGNPVDGFGGWYEANFNEEGKAGRYWRVMQDAIVVDHSPRSGQVEFYGTTEPPTKPTVKSTSPKGNTVRKTATLQIELEDGTLTQVAPGSIQLLVNGKAVVPTVAKPAGSKVSTLTFNPNGALLEGTNSVNLTFSDTGSPASTVTTQYNFIVINDTLAALVVNIDLNGVRNDPGPDQIGPTYQGQGAAGGGSIWNGVLVDSRTQIGADDNDNLSVAAANLLDSIGGATTVGFSINPVGGDVGGNPTTNPTQAPALFSDYLFVGFGAQITLKADFTINVPDVPSVDLYFYNQVGTITIPGSQPETGKANGIFNANNTRVFKTVPVTNGKITGSLNGDPGRLAGLTIVKPAPHALVRSRAPAEGTEAYRTAVIRVELQDNVSLVVRPSIRLVLNGTAVSTVIAKTGDITTVTYDQPGPLPQGLNKAQIIFSDNASTPLTVTNDWNFLVVSDSRLIVTPEMLSGPLVFFASPNGLTHKAPIPYGIANNVTDSGWIWPQDDTGELDVDFGVPTELNRFRAFSSYGGGPRGADWAIEYSTNNTDWQTGGDFLFETSNGGGVNNDGSARTDAGGWYEVNFNEAGKEARYWRIRQVAHTISHAPRVAQVEFYAAVKQPSVKSLAPLGGNNPRNVNIVIELEDGLNKVAPATVQLTVNGAVVAPNISKPAGSKVSTLIYDPPTNLPLGINTVKLTFSNEGTPAVIQTEEWIFQVNETAPALVVAPVMLSGPLKFFASPPGLTFAYPIPYGVTNNVADSGWIWPSDNTGSLATDFGTPTTVNRFRVFSTYPGGSRGANWAIEFSNDGLSWGKATDFPFVTLSGVGANDDGSKRADFGGWYEIAFNADNKIGARYWRIRQTAVLVSHAPRCGQFEFFGSALPPLSVSPSMLSGSLNFFASPPGLVHTNPIPYGIKNNVADSGWIWPQDNSGLLAVDFRLPTVLHRFRVFSTYPGGARGALWAIEYSNDKISWAPSTEALFETQAGLGTNDDGTPRADFGGWYGLTFNESGVAARYWRVRQVRATISHAPRCGQVEFYGAPISPLPITPEMTSGPLTFFASPAGLTHTAPLPYGITNNVADSGWIWPQDNSGLLAFDFGAPQALGFFRIYSSYAGGGRGALWAIESSPDNTTWTTSIEYPFETTLGGGVNDDGSSRTDYGGWFGTSFNSAGIAARYWRIHQIKATVSHAPRAAQIELYAPPANSGLQALKVQRQGNGLVIQWNGAGILQSADNLTAGPWKDVLNATSPLTVTTLTDKSFYRLRK
ncbi:MAG: hypothetical protein EXS36_12925 [Pedosphaera sp.]|nr:hypothetical protein [Pedosphaera sp.]